MMDESEIPIDIHTNKLMDWLVSRRHVPRDWQTKIIVIRQKINEAIKDMPVHEGIAALLSGSYINYYHCQKIVKILEETESNSKNFFGQYGSQRMKDWREVVKLYEKDNVYLGEVASFLLRNVNYEIPALRKQIQKSIQQRTEYEKREQDYEKQANNIKNEINTAFKELGISGKNIRLELLQKATDLPKLNKKIADDTSKLKKAVEFYKSVVSALVDSKREILKHLQFVIEKGDVTVYEWRNGEPPKSIESSTLDLKAEDENAEEDAIDFGVDDLDLGTDAGGDIDWGISTDDAAPEESQAESGVARGIDARTFLGHPETRSQFINDIMELEAFIKLRQYELRSGDSLSLSMLPDALLSVDENGLNEMLTCVKNVLNGLNHSTNMHYFNINTNTSYVDQLAKKLTQKIQTQEKLEASKLIVREQAVEVAKEGDSIQPKVQLLIDRTRELQEQIEVDISKRYNGRPVNLMGGVNNL